VGAASSRDHLISRLKAAPTRVFYGYLDFPDKRLLNYVTARVLAWLKLPAFAKKLPGFGA
jgi:hypothetical protein